MRWVSLVLALGAVAGVLTFPGAAQPQQPLTFPPVVAVRPIEPPAVSLPAEVASARERRFSFIAYGDSRSVLGGTDGKEINPNHKAVIDAMLAKIQTLKSTLFPVRFVLQTGDAVVDGRDGNAWNVSFTPLIDRLGREAGVPYFFTAGNHDVAAAGDLARPLGLNNLLSANARLFPPEGSPRRLSGYPTYAFGYGHLFAIALDSNISADPLQLAWVTDQLEHLDRSRYRHVIAFFHHPPLSSGPHGGVAAGAAAQTFDDNVERATAGVRTLYIPLFRRFHVRLTLTGHDHLYDHWIERYSDAGVTYRRDDLVTGGGGAPVYVYRGEPEVRAYLAAGASQNVRLEHPMRPGATPQENPSHFVVIRVDGDRLSLEVVGARAAEYKPYKDRSGIDLSDSN